MDTSVLYQDESGSLVLETCRVITVAALIVAQRDVGLLHPVLPRLRKKLNQQRKVGKKITREFKFQTLYESVAEFPVWAYRGKGLAKGLVV